MDPRVKSLSDVPLELLEKCQHQHVHIKMWCRVVMDHLCFSTLDGFLSETTGITVILFKQLINGNRKKQAMEALGI